MAMRAEARPVIESLRLVHVPGALGPVLPAMAYERAGSDRTLSLVLTGIDEDHGVDLIATQPATLTAHEAIKHYQPDLLINAGAAGGFASMGAAIGDVYLASRLVFHDRRVDLPGFDRSALGDYPAIDPTDLARRLGLKVGVVSTGNALDHSEHDLGVMRRCGAVVKDMEAAAIAWVARLHGVPFTALKAVTDLVDSAHPTAEQFEQNLDMAARELARCVTRLVDAVAATA